MQVPVNPSHLEGLLWLLNRSERGGVGIAIPFPVVEDKETWGGVGLSRMSKSSSCRESGLRRKQKGVWMGRYNWWWQKHQKIVR